MFLKIFSFLIIFLAVPFNNFNLLNEQNKNLTGVSTKASNSEFEEKDYGSIVTDSTIDDLNLIIPKDGFLSLQNGNYCIISYDVDVSESEPNLYYSIMESDGSSYNITSTQAFDMHYVGSESIHWISPLPNGNYFIFGDHNQYTIINGYDGSIFYEGELAYPQIEDNDSSNDNSMTFANDFSLNPKDGTIISDYKTSDHSNSNLIIFKPVEGSNYTEWEEGSLINTIPGFVPNKNIYNPTEIVSLYWTNYFFCAMENLSINYGDANKYTYILLDDDGNYINSFLQPEGETIRGNTISYVTPLIEYGQFLWFGRGYNFYYVVDFINKTTIKMNLPSSFNTDNFFVFDSENILLTDLKSPGTYSIISPAGEEIYNGTLSNQYLMKSFSVDEENSDIFILQNDWNYTILTQENLPPSIQTNISENELDRTILDYNYQISDTSTSTSTKLDIYEAGEDQIENTDDDTLLSEIILDETNKEGTVEFDYRYGDELNLYSILTFTDATTLEKEMVTDPINYKIDNYYSPIVNSVYVSNITKNSVDVYWNITDLDKAITSITIEDSTNVLYTVQDPQNNLVSSTTINNLEARTNYSDWKIVVNWSDQFNNPQISETSIDSFVTKIELNLYLYLFIFIISILFLILLIYFLFFNKFIKL